MLAFSSDRYNWNTRPKSFIEAAPWKFTGTADLPVPVDVCFDIISGDESVSIMYPSFSNVVYLEPIEAPGRRTITINGLLGENEVEEDFDSFDNEGDVRSYSFYFVSSSNPILFVSRGREKYVCEALSDATSRFTVTAGLQPNAFLKLLSFLAIPTFQGVFRGAADRLLEWIQSQK